MKKSDNNNFAENIKALRLSRALSQLEMATRLNVSRTAYAQYEAGTRFPDMETIVQISDIISATYPALVRGIIAKGYEPFDVLRLYQIPLR